MDDKTLQAVIELAYKLGTTAEHLFGVLIKQAPISGAVDLVIMTVLIAFSVQWFRFVKKKTTESSDPVDRRYPDWDGDCAFLAWMSSGILVMLTTITVGCGLPSTIAAFVNPEYWAIMQILN